MNFFFGNFIILNGIIIDKIYFSSNHKYKNGIKIGSMINLYIILIINQIT